MPLINQLNDLGLNTKEAKIYLGALQLGRASISELAKQAEINRATAYFVVNSLKNKGLISSSVQKKRRFYSPAEPQKIEVLLKQKQELLKNILPQLEGLNNLTNKKPKIEFYEGEKGIINLFLDNLNAKDEILTIAGEQTFNDLIIREIPDYIEKRLKNRVVLKLISSNTPKMVAWQEADKQQLRITKLVSREKFPFKVNIDIYNDKIVMTSPYEKFGLIIESRDLTETMRLFFNLAWEYIPYP